MRGGYTLAQSKLNLDLRVMRTYSGLILIVSALAHIQSLSESGKLLLAGPFYEANNYRGIFIFNTTDLEEARAWVTADPAVQAEILKAELMPWYASAALHEIPTLHRKAEKLNP